MLVEEAAADVAAGGVIEVVVAAVGFKAGVASGASDSTGGSATAVGVTAVTFGAVIFACEPVGTLGTVGVVA